MWCQTNCSVFGNHRLPVETDGIPHLLLVGSVVNFFYVLLTVLLSITLVNDQIYAQIFCYSYYDPLHVSSNILLILRRSNCINTESGIVTLKTSV